jgi:hypothetical protein
VGRGTRARTIATLGRGSRAHAKAPSPNDFSNTLSSP